MDIRLIQLVSNGHFAKPFAKFKLRKMDENNHERERSVRERWAYGVEMWRKHSYFWRRNAERSVFGRLLVVSRQLEDVDRTSMQRMDVSVASTRSLRDCVHKQRGRALCVRLWREHLVGLRELGSVRFRCESLSMAKDQS